MSKISKVAQRVALHDTEEQTKNDPFEEPLPKHILVDTKGEVIEVNGIRFAGRCMVPRDYASTVKRLVQERLYQNQKNKQYKEHKDKQAIVFGGRR